VADARIFDQGTRPRILINWQSFTAEGISAAWQGPFTDAVINAYTRWMNMAGVDLRPQFFGYTANTSPAAGEIIIRMDPAFGGGPVPRLASTFSTIGGNTSTIILHRRNAVDMSPWPWVAYNAQAGQIDMQGVLMHELGHALGLLDHSPSSNDTMFAGYVYQSTRFGPFEGDVARLKALYSDFTQNRLRQLRSLDGGASWSPAANELTAINHVHARTAQSPGVAAIRRTGLYNLGWNHTNRIPSWLRTDGDRALTRAWFFFGGERSVHGSAYASDDRGTLLWAWVQNDDNATIKVVRSTNSGLGWGLVNAPVGACSGGTPGLAWTRVGGQPTWILVWSHFDRADQANTGFVRASVSTNDGLTWSAPVYLNQVTKALSGVGVAANDGNQAIVTFAYANQLSTSALNDIITIACAVTAGALQSTNTIWTGERTRIQPALVYDAPHGQFIMAWREQNFATTLATASIAPGGGAWGPKVLLLGSPSHVAPALGSVAEYSEAALWHAYEGQ
jgi:Matrixin